jgi:prevent-host-death family protein
MITVGAFEAKTKLSELLDRVERGEEVLITRHGKNVARLVGLDEAEKAQQRDAAVARFNAVREQLRREGVSFTIEDVISARDEGRR